MNAVVVILYEDQRGPTKEFGLHNLVTACVSDLLGKTLQDHTFRQLLDGRPMKGVDKVLRSCRSEVPRLAPQGQTVFVLVDDDQVRRRLRGEGISESAPASDVVQAIKARSSKPDQLEVVLLEKNLETVLEAAGECDKDLSQPLLVDALRKAPAARDRILNTVAWRGDRAARDCILGRVPSLRRFVQALADVVRSAASGAP